jgi:hypothetical protein
VKKSIDFSFDDHPEGDERATTAWVVSATDDCEACADLRVELTLEEQGRAGAGVVAHLSASSARRLRVAIGDALREIGENPDR